ncbi:MAG TPA: Crp/Fnr family transcriptional regulator [Gaiellaceae bacterium]|jgi:CRP-like cAMP-binding protein|nr:Crp/Fnr family transcriptional regulator [Gaiellaceae bacterium]
MSSRRRTTSFLLSSVAPPARLATVRLLAACPVVSISSGSMIGGVELPSSALLVVEEGVAATTRSLGGEPGKRMVLSISGPAAVLPSLAADEELAALTDVRATAVTPEALRGLLALPDAAHAITLGLLDTLQEGRESLAQLGDAPHAERLREKLLQLARRHGRVVPDGVRIDVPLTHELLAQTVRSARETVTLALGDLEREGFLVRDGRSYRLRVRPESLSPS